MWPFKKQKKQSAEKSAIPILCIPGKWMDFEGFHESLIVSSGAGYMVVGDILINGKDKHHYKIEFCNRDERMQTSFRAAGKVTEIGEETLLEIADHKYVVYIFGTNGGMEEAEHIARAGLAILKAGGIAIKVESTGKAFSKSDWLELMVNFEPQRHLYDMFVLDSLIDVDGTVFSCGMHNLGYKDTIVSDEAFEDARRLIRIFAFYQIVDKPFIKGNETFQLVPDAPLFRIREELSPPYKEGELLHNPFGLWRLTKVRE